MPQLKLDEKTHQKLVKLAGHLQSKLGKRMSLRETIAYLIDYYVGKENVEI